MGDLKNPCLRGGLIGPLETSRLREFREKPPTEAEAHADLIAIAARCPGPARRVRGGVISRFCRCVLISPLLCYRCNTASQSRAAILRPGQSACFVVGNGSGGRTQENVSAAGIDIVYAHCESGFIAWAGSGPRGRRTAA